MVIDFSLLVPIIDSFTEGEYRISPVLYFSDDMRCLVVAASHNFLVMMHHFVFRQMCPRHRFDYSSDVKSDINYQVMNLSLFLVQIISWPMDF